VSIDLVNYVEQIRRARYLSRIKKYILFFQFFTITVHDCGVPDYLHWFTAW
jgi:hypothetical protein